MDSPWEAAGWRAGIEAQAAREGRPKWPAPGAPPLSPRQRHEPSWFLVGAEKAGTTSLFHYLQQHPQLLLVDPKEPHYYSHRLDHAEYRGPMQEAVERRRYLAPYRSRREVLAGDCSTSYLWHLEAPKRIAREVPEARILVLLRDPVQRAWSHFLMNRRMEGTDSFEDALDYDHEWVQHGLYGEQMDRYVGEFDSEQIMVQYTEDLASNPYTVLERFARHLNVNPESVYHVDATVRHNPHRRSRLAERLRPYTAWVPRAVRDAVGQRLEKPAPRPRMPTHVQDQLQEWFRPDVEHLLSLGVLDEPPPWGWLR